MTAQKILIDTDPGQDIDDLLAIWFALKRPELDVVGITTVTYPAAGRARLVKRLLRHLGREDIPVGVGMDHPLRQLAAHEAERLRDLAWSMNHASFAEPEDPRDDPGTLDAVDLIVRAVDAHPGEVLLACIAPLTNIACALRRRPDIAGKLKGIALMGGEVALNRTEHNIAFDYVAADIVLSSGVPLAMGTWDVTRRFTLGLEECRTLFTAHGSPLAIAMAEALRVWHPAQSWKPGPVMYDLFPMVWAFDRSFYETKPMAVRVETRGEFTRGMTVIRGDTPNVEVTVDARAAALRDLFLSTVLS